MSHFVLALVGEVFLGPRHRPRGPRPVYQQIPAVRHGIFSFSGISLTNYRYYIQTVKYKSKETLFWGENKCFFEESAELEPRLLNELKGNSFILSQQPPTRGGGGVKMFPVVTSC